MSPIALVLLLLYPLQAAQIVTNNKDLEGLSLLYGVFMVAAKFAENAGIGRFGLGLLKGRRSSIIEYKDGARPPTNDG